MMSRRSSAYTFAVLFLTVGTVAGCDALADLFGLAQVVGDRVEMTHTGGDEPARMAVTDKHGELYSKLVAPGTVAHIRLDLGEVVRFQVLHHQSGALLAQTSCNRQADMIHDAMWYPWEKRLECVIRSPKTGG
jgi:hypothetical protein